MSKEIKQVVFDLGAVIIEWNPQRIVEMVTLDRTLQEEIMQKVFDHPDMRL